jgi:hypothetical protein
MAPNARHDVSVFHDENSNGKLDSLTLPAVVTAVAGIQALWWMAAAIALVVRSVRLTET